ncbi:MAG: bifunctional UDP-N-acetylglucosamine diphosphorylase/glucosamine-1-phosphate N-acetyltransferase GlmU [Desulfuromonadales bacterium]
MDEQRLASVILAAGKGTRMKSDTAKVLHEIVGEPMILPPVRAGRQCGCDPSVVVLGHQGEDVEKALAGEKVTTARQEEQLGTGHALLCAESALRDFRGSVLLLCGDVPLIRPQTLSDLLECHRREKAAVTVLTARLDDPHGYGRIVRDGDEVNRIVEEKDAGEAEKKITEINTGIYVFEAPFVFDALRDIGCDNAQGEYYLTDTIEMARKQHRPVRAVTVEDPREVMGINDRVQLAEATAIMRERINAEWMRRGVTLVDPETTYIEANVTLDPDTIIEPGVHLRGSTSIGQGGRIEPGVVVTDCSIGDRVHLKTGSVLNGAKVGDGTDIGPMAHLRPGTVLDGENKIGNFVETKKATFGRGSKASHLTYIGDAEVGSGVNIGCGTITCNYDGVNKHRTVIEDEVFVGSDTQFVAPVRIGKGALIGAGSTITRDVPPEALALSRAEQKVIEGWVAKKRKKQKKN